MATFGQTTIGTPFQEAHDKKRTFKATLTEDGYFYGIYAYLGGAGLVFPSRNMVLRGITYTDNAGVPDAFDTVTNQVTVFHDDAPAWRLFEYPAEVLRTAGDYWIGLWSGDTNIAALVYPVVTPGTTLHTMTETYSATSDPNTPWVDDGFPFGTNTDTSYSVYVAYAPAAATPVNVTAPVVYGAQVLGCTLTADKGTWAGNVSGYSYQWQRDGVDIGGETATTYVVQVADAGATISCDVTATNGVGDTTVSSAGLADGYSNWSPTVQQFQEPDTIWLFDPDWEAANYPDVATGGVVCTDDIYGITGEGCNPWRIGSSHQIVPGKYISGITGGDTAGFYVYEPGIPLPSSQFTFEFWVKRTADWDTGDSQDVFAIGDSGNSTFMHLYSNIAGVPFFEVGNRQAAPATPALEPSLQIYDTYVPSADEWVGYAVTYDGATLTLYRTSNGTTVLVGSVSMDAPFAWTPAFMQSFVMIGSEAHASDDWVISDVRFSRRCRVPGVPIPVTSANTVTVTDTPTGSTVNRLVRGGVSVPLYDNDANRGMVSANVAFTRLSKGLNGTPIKAGAPDATHPTLGHSGAYSYDWRLVDNSYNYLNALGITSHDGLQSCPQILGGTNPPATEPQLSDPGFFMNYMTENNQVPNDFSAYATICADYFHYVTVTRGETVEGWWFWNEPDITWPGTILQHSQLFGAVEAAVRAVDPNVYLVAPDASSATDGITQYVGDATNGLLKYCADNGHRVDAIAFHGYNEDYGLAAYLRDYKVAFWADAYGYTTNAPDIIVNEWAKAVGFGRQPWGDDAINKWGFNDWNASASATYMAAAQILGYKWIMFYALAPAEVTAPNATFDSDALFSATHPWTGLNVFEVFRRLEG